VTTIHGWDVIEDRSDPRLRQFDIPGTERGIRLRKDVGPYLVAFAAEYHKVIAPIDKGTFDDWGWSPLRKGRASSHTSDHCGGVAMDLNATAEGSQGSGSLKFWANPIKKTRLALLRKRYSLLEFGGDYSAANRDPMHWTFDWGVNRTIVAVAMKKLGINSDGIRTKP
jgi:hypothetical protein